MKKTFLLLCFVLCFAALFTSCLDLGDSDDLFSPPSWIRGTWGDTTQTYVYVFSVRNVQLSSPFYASSPFSVLYADNDVAETVTDSLYEITVSEDSTLIMNYRFEKLTSTTLSFTAISLSHTTGPLQLVKE